MKGLSFILLLLCPALPLPGQLTKEQKPIDFQTLVAQYAKRYAPYEWKRQIFGFDLLNIAPFVQRIADSRDDLEFYEICVDYVASLHDGHVFLSLTSRFVATLNFSTDIYDGKVLIEGINRSLLPASDYPFQIGDEVVSVDGSSAEELIRDFSKYVTDGNVRSTRRSATELIPVRPQSIMPHAPDVGDKATVVIRRSNDDLETYLIPWTKTGVPLLQAGLVPNPKTLVARSAVSDVSLDSAPYLRTIAEFQIARAPIERGVSGLRRTSAHFRPALEFQTAARRQ
jgi:hypothetical protein